MSELIWKGYIVLESGDSVFIQSPFTLNGKIVYGPDSDSTTMSIAGIQYLISKGHKVNSIHLPPAVDGEVVYISTLADSPSRSEELDSNEVIWQVMDGDEATLLLSKQDNNEFDFDASTFTVEIDAELYTEIQKAWLTECSELHVSQGAYVSQAQYREGSSARLNLTSQIHEGKTIWPPRQLDENGISLAKESKALSGSAQVESWTKLSAAGAPSEFSLRAPILGGIQTLLVRFAEGPRGVFLVCDDEDYSPNIGDSIEFGVRRIYAQEGYIRYGMKAIPIRGQK